MIENPPPTTDSGGEISHLQGLSPITVASFSSGTVYVMLKYPWGTLGNSFRLFQIVLLDMSMLIG
jgi:hypothetical protein